MTLRPICGNSAQLLNPGPGSEITIYGSNNQELWIEVKKLENTYWGEPNSNYVLDYKLIEMDETVSFRYWRLFFNKSYEGVEGYQTQVGLSEWKIYLPLSSLSNMITEDYIIDENYAYDINVRTITKPVTLSSDYYRYWRLVINESVVNQYGGNSDNNLLTLWRPEINKPIENYIIVNNADNQEVIDWALTSYNLSGVNLIYREGPNEVFTNINKTFNLELFKVIIILKFN